MASAQQVPVQALVLGEGWWRTDANLTTLVHQVVHFLRRYGVSVHLLYPRRREDLRADEQDEMRQCQLDGVLCAHNTAALDTAVPADCLRHAHHLYYKYLLNDAQTFGNFSHIIAFAPDMASAAIRIKEDLKTSYGREVKVVLINYRTMSYDSDEQLLDCLEEQDWFSRRNISQVWSLGQSLFDHYKTTHIHGDRDAPHSLLLFRPTFDCVRPDPGHLQFLLSIIPADLSESAITANNQLKAVATAVTDLHIQSLSLGQQGLQWTVATTATGLTEELREVQMTGQAFIKVLDSKYISKREAFLRQVQQSRVYVSPVEDNSAFNALDWMLAASGLPTLVSCHSCVGETLEQLGKHHSSVLPKQFVVRPPAFGDIPKAWMKMISDVLQGGEGQTAIKNAEDLRDLIQRSDFICRIEEDFMYSLQQSRGHAVQPVGPSQDPFSVRSKTLCVYPVVANTPPKDVSVPELIKTAERIGNDWYRLGLKLNIPSYRLDTLVQPAQGGPERHPIRMLQKWHQLNANQTCLALVRKLIDALKEARLVAIGDNVHQYFSNNSDTRGDIDMMLLFESISVSLVPHWKDVGYQLELVFDDINQIAAPEQLPANHERKMLEMWMLSTPLNERRTRLIAALRVMGRLDIIQILEPDGCRQGDHTCPAMGSACVNPDVHNRNRPTQEQDGGDWASGHGTHGMALPSDDGAGATGRNRMTYPPSEDVLQAQDDNRPLPSSRLTEVNKVSVEEGAEDEEVDVDQIHRPPGYRPEPIERLNPDYLWMGGDCMRLRRAIEGRQHKKVVVALLDSGVLITHPDLMGMVVHNHNCIYGQPDQDLDLVTDSHDHGTASAGILWQYAGSSIVQILNLKVLRHDSTGKLSYVANALEYIKTWDIDHPDQKVDIILMTLGNRRRNKKTDRLLSELGEDKILICSAANEGQRKSDSVLSPANHGSVIAIGSCKAGGSRCDHSAVGQQLAFLFPGESIMSTSSSFRFDDPVKRNKYSIQHGTSFAAPHCAALVAILLAYVEVQLDNFDNKPGRHWRRLITASSRMMELLKKFCHRTFTYDMGYGSPQLEEITRNSLKDFVKAHWNVNTED